MSHPGWETDGQRDRWMDVVFTCDILVLVQGECPEVTPTEHFLLSKNFGCPYLGNV